MSAIVRASYPVSFQLLNRDRQPILGIFEGQQGQTLKLDITNSSRRDMKTKQLTGNPTADNHHFELRFRPGTLVLPSAASPRPAITVAETGWKISDTPVVSDGGVSFYLLITNPITIESGKSTSLTLNNLSGDGKVGAHGTRVELKWSNNLEYVASASGQSPEPLVPGHRLQHLSIVNQSGQQHIPLHVGFVGNDKVLNNNSDNVLTLRITNLLKKDEGNIELNPERGLTKPPATKFIVSFDFSPPSTTTPVQINAWALGFQDHVGNIKIKNSLFDIQQAVQGQSPQWTLTPLDQITLEPGKSLDLTIDPIKTAHPSGLTNLYLKYKNIPGYWDGNFVTLIEKAPLVYGSSGVGIGTNDPKVPLDVKGKVRAQTLLVSATGTEGSGVPTPADALHVVGNILLGTIPTQIKCVNDDHRLIFDVDAFEIRERQAIVFSPGSNNNQKTARAVITADGKVGIGTPIPDKHLHVAGTGEQEIMIQSTDQHGGGKWALRSSGGGEAANKIWRETGRFDIINRTANESRFTIERDGNVGIGTVWPGHLINEGNYFRADRDGRILEVHSPGHEAALILSSGQDATGAHLGGVYFTRTGGQSDAHREVAAIKCTQAGSGTLGSAHLQFFTKPTGDGLGFDKPRMIILENGRIGIGTTTPAAPLHVMGGQANSFTLARWMDGLSLGEKGGQRSDLKHSIIADERIRASAFDTVSDARFKTILGPSGGASDLDALLKIIITDYTYKDVITKGNGTHKKVIGQQIEKVFPQAVSRCTDVVPDIYQRASIQDGWIALATDLKKGDRVKLIAESGKEDMHEVLEVTGDKFRVDLEPEGEKVFVYGREVDDFLTVDYDAISMLNVSATQQLKKDMDQELNALRVENAELRSANDALAKRLERLEAKLQAAVSVMAAANGSNGNGRH